MIRLNGEIVSWVTFPNQEVKVKDFMMDTSNKTYKIELKYESDQDLVNLMFVKKRLDEFHATVTLFIKYMPYSRMDRKIEGDLFTLSYICEWFASMHFREIVVCEPHSCVTLALLKKNGVNARAIYPVKDWLFEVMDTLAFTENDYIVFPDKGARSRYNDLKLNNLITLDKVRDPQSGQIQAIEIHEGTVPANCKCLIIDDLCSRGGTFEAASKLLKAKGASQVYLLVAHCEDTIFDGNLLKQDSPIDFVFTSDSMLTKAHPKIKMLQLEESKYDI